MRKIFLSLGHGDGKHISFLNEKFNFINNKGWIYEYYDPNPYLDNKNLIKKGVDIENGHKDFITYKSQDKNILSKKDLYNKLLPGSHIIDNSIQVNNIGKIERKFNIETLDICDILNRFRRHTIVVYMNIEGMEYKVLRKLINEKLIKKIEELYIETHSKYVTNENEITNKKLLNDIKKLGVKVYELI